MPVDKPFPDPDHFVDNRSLVGVLGPTLLNELPHLHTKSKFFGGLWLCRSLPTGDLDDRQFILRVPERNFPAEHLHSKHSERKDVGGLGYHHWFGTRFWWIGDLRGEPPRRPCDSWCRRNCEDWGRDDVTEAVIADPSSSSLGYYHIGLNRSHHRYGLGLGGRATHSFQTPVNNPERVKISKPFGDL